MLKQLACLTMAGLSIIFNAFIAQACVDDELLNRQPLSFIEWCQQRESASLEVQSTVNALLSSARTNNCLQAEKSLRSIKRVYSTAYLENRPLRSDELVIQVNEAMDLRPLVAVMPELQGLFLVNVPVRDLSTLQTLKSLTVLVLNGTDLTMIQPIGELKSLTYLDLSGNQIEDISSLSQLVKLRTLYVTHNQIRNFSVLSKLSSLSEINIQQNPIDNSTCGRPWIEACEP